LGHTYSMVTICLGVKRKSISTGKKKQPGDARNAFPDRPKK
jgi:hypothetical protein